MGDGRPAGPGFFGKGKVVRQRLTQWRTALVAVSHQSDTRFKAITALAAMPDRAAIGSFIGGLGDKNPDLRTRRRDAIASMRDQVRPHVDELAKRGEIPPAVVGELQSIFAGFLPVTNWRIVRPFPNKRDAKFPPEEETDFDAGRTYAGFGDKQVAWREVTGDAKTGVFKGESPDAIELADADGKRHSIPKADIEQKKLSPLSIMSNGLSNGMTLDDFADIIAFLESLREPPAK